MHKPQLNVGIITGSASGIMVLDIDGQEGEDFLKNRPTLPVTWEVKTGKGRHIYFRYPKGTRLGNKVRLGPKIDFRGEGGYVVAPPSVHPDTGMPYEWMASPSSTEIADAPEWLLDLLLDKESNSSEAHHTTAEPQGMLNVDELPQDLKKALFDLSFAVEGGRNNQLNKAAFLAGQYIGGGLNEEAITDMLTNIAHQIGLDEKETAATLKSGLRAGKKDPLSWFSNSPADWAEPRPFMDMIPLAEPYPIDVLPAVMQAAVMAHHHTAQQPISLIAASAHGVLALAGQGLANVVRDEGLEGPISLNLMVIAKSGERKSAADKAFTNPIHEWMTEKKDQMQAELASNAAKLKIYHTRLKQIETLLSKPNPPKSSPPKEVLEEELTQLFQNPPPKVYAPDCFYEDTTMEALLSGIGQNWPSAALMSDEAGLLIGSHAFKQENALAAFANLNRFWDGKPIKRTRITTGTLVVKGRRLSVVLMMQPSVFLRMLGICDNEARNTGFLARALLTMPESTIGRRLYTPQTAEDRLAMAEFGKAVKSLLSQKLNMDPVTGALTPRLLPLSKEGKDIWQTYHDDIEGQCARGKRYASIPDIASKSADNAARLAALYQLLENPNSIEVSVQNMQRATIVARWHLNEVGRVLEYQSQAPLLENAESLLEWLLERPDRRATLQEVSQYGPYRLRMERSARKRAIALLEEHHMALERKIDGKTYLLANPHLYNSSTNRVC
jgi:putative DNA primase/helicase